MELIAHFTAEELPGTALIFTGGIALGIGVVVAHARGLFRR